MLFNKQKQTPQQEAAYRKLQTLIQEIEIEQSAFMYESGIRVRNIEKHLEHIKHNLLVAKHDLEVNMNQALRKVTQAAKGILLTKDLQ